MGVTLYHDGLSTPSRTALYVAKTIGIDFEIKNLDLLKKEQLSESFIKINPQHTVPTLVDNGFVLWESRAIAMYLAEKYDSTNTLYPKDLKKRAVINQLIFFDATSLYLSHRDINAPLIYGNDGKIPIEKKQNLYNKFKLLNMFLEGKDWLTGDTMTIADIINFGSITTMLACGWNPNKPGCENVVKWIERCKKNVKGYDKNDPKLIAYVNIIKQKLGENETYDLVL